MPKPRTRKWDPARHLDSSEAVALYLRLALEEGDPAVLAAVLGDIARSKGMAEVARRAGMGRESLYKALSRKGNPEFATVIKVLNALGLQLQAVPMKNPTKAASKRTAAESKRTRTPRKAYTRASRRPTA